METSRLSGTLLTTLLLAAAVFFPPALQAAEPLQLVVYGASARIGGRIVEEALERGHRVVGVSRNPDTLTLRHEHFSAVPGDVTDINSVRAVITGTGADAVIVSLSGNSPGNDPARSTHSIAAQVMVAVLGELGADAPRVLQVGGATTMYETREAMLEHLPFPAEEGSPMFGMLFGHLEALHTYRASDVDWTVVTPPLDIIGWRGGIDRRSGEYRTATDHLVMDADGNSAVTLSDLAVAVVDEAENGAFIRQRFTVGY